MRIDNSVSAKQPPLEQKQSRKPSTRVAMQNLIGEIRSALPFDLNPDDICKGECKNCSIKLLEYMQSELDGWQIRLDQDEIPNFGDLSRLARSGQKIHRALEKNGLIKSATQEED